MDILKYKDYEGTATIDMSRRVCRGKILFIDDVVTYEANSPAELQKEFELAVDDYIETCVHLKREPQKPLKGLFNVRIPPSLHKSAVLRSLTDNISLNDVVVRSLDSYLNIQSNINNNINLTLNVPEESFHILTSNTSAQPQWKRIENVKTH